MKHCVPLLVLLFAVPGCKSDKDNSETSRASQTRPATPQAQPATKPQRATKQLRFDSVGRTTTAVSIGDAKPQELPFEISAVHAGKKPATAAPWYQDGGKWTYIVAKTKTGAFTLGFESQPLQGLPFERATAQLSVPDKASHKALIAELAGALNVKPPTTLRYTGKPLTMSGVVLGRNQSRRAGGYGGKGDWVTCKWTVEGKNAKGEPENAEVYFNFNLKAKRGVFSEKDSDYNAFLVESFATRL